MPTSSTHVIHLVCVAITLASFALYAQQVTFNVSHFLPRNSNCQKAMLEPWCDRLVEDSGGKSKCPIYPAIQLGGPPPRSADQMKNAVADIVMTSPSDSPGRCPYTEAVAKRVVDGLPPELKAVLDKASGAVLVELAGSAWDKAIVDGRGIANVAGNKTLTVRPLRRHHFRDPHHG